MYLGTAVCDNYSKALAFAMKEKEEEYLGKISEEELYKFRVLASRNEGFYDKKELFSQESIDNYYSAKFFSKFNQNLLDIYSNFAIKNSPMQLRFQELSKHIHILISRANEIKFLTINDILNETPNITHEEAEREMNYYRWVSKLDCKLLKQTLDILQRVKDNTIK